MKKFQTNIHNKAKKSDGKYSIMYSQKSFFFGLFILSDLTQIRQIFFSLLKMIYENRKIINHTFILYQKIIF